MSDANSLNAVKTSASEYIVEERKRAVLAEKLRAQTKVVNTKFDALQTAVLAAEMTTKDPQG